MATGRPYILVPLQFFRENPKSELRVAAARDTYLKKLERYSLTPLFVSPFTADEAVDELYNMSSGVFCMGGSDIDPSYYNAALHPEAEVTEPDRDRLEQSIIKRVLTEKGRPFLGICRGIQSLCVASGGTLIQHLPDRIEEETHDVDFYFQLYTAAKHPVSIEPGSRLSFIIGKTAGDINSAHHQAVDSVGADFRVSARSPAGVVEAIEHTDRDFFCLGVQSHPEAEENGFFEPIFAEFAAQCRKFRS